MHDPLSHPFPDLSANAVTQHGYCRYHDFAPVQILIWQEVQHSQWIYEIVLNAETAFPKVAALMKAHKMEPSGPEWEAMLMRMVQEQHPQAMDGMRVASTPDEMVIQTNQESHCRALLHCIRELHRHPTLAERYLKGTLGMRMASAMRSLWANPREEYIKPYWLLER